MPKPAAASGRSTERLRASAEPAASNTACVPPGTLAYTAATTIAAGTVIMSVLSVPVITLVHRPPKYEYIITQTMPTTVATFQSIPNTVEMTTEVPFRLIRISRMIPKIIVTVTIAVATLDRLNRYWTNSEMV